MRRNMLAFCSNIVPSSLISGLQAFCLVQMMRVLSSSGCKVDRCLLATGARLLSCEHDARILSLFFRMSDNVCFGTLK